MAAGELEYQQRDPADVRAWKTPRGLYVPARTDQWDECPEPLKDEVFLSWFTRLAQANHADPVKLFHNLLDIKHGATNGLARLEFDPGLKHELIARTASHVKISPTRLAEMPLQVTKKRLKQTGWNYLNIPVETPRYCPFCLDSDPVPYFRYYWQLRFVTACLTHGCLLFEQCPHCGVPVRYWETGWNQAVTTCFNCQENMAEGISFVQRHVRPGEMRFQEQLIEIYRTGAFNSRSVNTVFFFKQLWKIASLESDDPDINALNGAGHSLSVERIYKALFLAFRALHSDPARLESPHDRARGRINSADKSKLVKHQRDKHGAVDQIFRSLTTTEREEAERRYRAIKPLLENPYRTRADMERETKEYGVSARTVYRWINRYENGGLPALAPQHWKKGNRTKRFLGK